MRNNIHASIVFLLFLGIMLPVLLLTVQHNQGFQQHAAGNSISASPGDNLQAKVNSLQPGDTLLLQDGNYTNIKLTINLKGTATAPITIKAANDGKANLDGGGNQGHMIYITNSSYVTFEGLVIHHAQWAVIDIWGPDDHITLRRITAYDAGSGNNTVFSLNNGATDILVEDCAGWGMGRYIFEAYHVNNIVFRRDFAYQAYTTNFSPAPRSTFGVYGSSNVTLENIIATHDIPTQQDDNYYTALWQTSDDPINFPNNNTKILGSIFYNNWEGYWVNGLAGNNTQFKDIFVQTPKITSGFTSKNQGDGLMWGAATSGSITNLTAANSVQGYYRMTGSATLANSVFIGNQTAIAGDNGHNYVDFYKNSNNGTTMNATDKQVDPGYDTTTFGLGAYLFIPNNSPLKKSGANGSDIGATILYRTVDGVLTNQPLWPWPMEDRIKSEKNVSVTWDNAGGIWKTLNGVYPNSTPIPSQPIPDITPTPTISTVPSAIPTATPSQGGTTLLLSICPHGLGNCGDNANPASTGNTTPQHQQRLVTVTLLNASNQPVTTAQGNVAYNPSSQNFKGTISLSNVTSGNYIVTVKTDGFLTKQLPGFITIATNQQVTLSSVALITGDINNDSQLDILDYNLLINCFGSKQLTASCTNPPTTQSTGADINDDGSVNGSDYNLFLRELSVQRGNG